MKKESIMKICLGVSALALAAALAVFAFLTYTERQLTRGEEQKEVWVVAEPVPKGLEVEAKDWERYLEIQPVPIRLIPVGAIEKAEDLPMGKLLVSLERNTILTRSQIGTPREELKQLQKPVIATVACQDYGAVVGGILREGDLVNLYFLGEDEEIHQMEKVLVWQVFDGSGETVGAEAENKSISRFNVLLEEKQAAEFYRLQKEYTLRTVKVLETENGKN